MMTDFKVLCLTGDDSAEQERWLRKFGANGWHLVAVVYNGADTYAYLERQTHNQLRNAKAERRDDPE